MKKSAFLIVALLISSSVSAQLSDSVSTFFEGPEGFLMTKQERKAWKKVTSDEEAEKFIELFWAKRDPDLSTAINEFRHDFNLRVEAADARFTYGSTRGALSDRAKVLYLLGQFYRRDNRPPERVATDVQNPINATAGQSRMVASKSLYSNQGATEIWEYRSEDLPVRVAQYYVHAVFLETDVDDNDYILDRSDASMMHILNKMPEVLVKNPDLTEVPRVGLIPGTRPATSEEVSWLEADLAPRPLRADTYVAAGLAPGPRHFLWAHLSLYEEVTEAASVVGRVRDAETGEELGSFAIPFDDVAMGGQACELSIPVVEGNWLLDVALTGNAGPLTLKTVEVQTAETPNGSTCVSPFVWGVNVRQESNWNIGDPFNIGGWQVVPVLNSRFLTPSAHNLSYMAYVFEPVLDSDGNPQFTVSISLSKDGRQVAQSPAQPAPLTRLAEGVWMFGRGLPLERFSQPGSYTLKVELEQTTDGANGVVEIPFEMVEEEPASDTS